MVTLKFSIMKSITVYTVESGYAEMGIYSNMDHAEIVKAEHGKGFEVYKKELTTTGTLEQDELSCFVDDETGQFTIQNENANVICVLQVLVDIDSEDEAWNTLDVTSHEINDEDYTVTLNYTNVKDINLTNDLQKYITSEVDNWISRTNRKNGF